ncbi:hypothetical protein ACFVW5_40845, partial [Streptomyces sp. NPDC058232]
LDTTVAALLKRPPGGPAPNQNERKAVSFLQRLAAPCEPTARAFGPSSPVPGYPAIQGRTPARGHLDSHPGCIRPATPRFPADTG